MHDFIYRGWLVLITESGHTDEILVGEGGRRRVGGERESLKYLSPDHTYIPATNSLLVKFFGSIRRMW